MDQKIQGIVEIEAVIESDGTVGEVKVVRSLDAEFGLDEEAVKAVKKWLFKPGKKDGVAVPVLVNIEMTFTLRKWAAFAEAQAPRGRPRRGLRRPTLVRQGFGPRQFEKAAQTSLASFQIPNRTRATSTSATRASLTPMDTAASPPPPWSCIEASLVTPA
jgi:TonB family protein